MPNLMEDALRKLRAKMTGKDTPINGTSADILHVMAEEYEPSAGVTSWNDLEDRPFGEEVEYVDILSEATYICENPVYACFTESENFISKPDVGANCKVTINGQVYDVTAYASEELDFMYEDEGVVALGDGNPFIIAFRTGDYANLNFAEAGTYTLSVVGEKEVVKTIDEKYLPESVKGGGGSSGMVAVAFNNYDGSYKPVGATFEEVLSAIDNGIYVAACLYLKISNAHVQYPLTRATVLNDRESITFLDTANSVDYIYNSDGSFHIFEPEE